ncbi:MAG: hypothetical protein GY810_17725 [Aureispira sp.]|nr:hypothetical protein [Aureispira sp.]
MRQYFLLILTFLLLGSAQHDACGQTGGIEDFGIRLIGEWNIYSSFRKPLGNNIAAPERSVRQAVNVMPNLGLGFWIGVPMGMLSLEGGAGYMPMATRKENTNGKGALMIPLSLRYSLFGGAHSVGAGFSIAAGVNLIKTELHKHPETGNSSNQPFFPTYFAELSLDVIKGSSANLHSLGIYARMGWGLNQSTFFNLGLRYSFWYNFLED